MKMLRTFHPIGQGAFYTEQFDYGINVVYDCGTETGTSIVNKAIKSTFDKGETIQAVFISHLHDDHINGLECLLKHCVVKELYIPFRTPEEIVLSRVEQKLNNRKSSKFIDNFIRDPERAIHDHKNMRDKDAPKIIYVLSDSELHRNHDNEKNTIRSGQRLHFPDVSYRYTRQGWVYVPYNFDQAERAKEFKEKLLEEGIDINDADKIDNLLNDEKGIKKLREIYAKVPGNLNENSMTVYSGPDGIITGNGNMQRLVRHHGCESLYCCCGIAFSQGCIYTGDYSASTKKRMSEFVNAYANRWETVGILQIPHHGSEKNFNKDLLDKAEYFIISAGYNNLYKHPDAAVLKDMILNDKPFAWVTEQVGSGIRFEVQIHQR